MNRATILPPDIERLALLGWRLHPSARHSRAACIKNAAAAATCDLETLEMWTWEFLGCNWRVTPGGSGIWAMDVDAPGLDHSADRISELRRLCKVHGDAAALAAHRIVSKSGLTWHRVLERPVIEKRAPELGWRETCAACLARPGSLRPWEIAFLRDLPAFRRPSVKQRCILREIADRVLGGRTA
jgi:hypothetical protein